MPLTLCDIFVLSWRIFMHETLMHAEQLWCNASNCIVYGSSYLCHALYVIGIASNEASLAIFAYCIRVMSVKLLTMPVGL